MDFPTLYCQNPAVIFETVGESLTQQQFKDDADINVILKRFQENPSKASLGEISTPRVPMWGDFSNVPSVREAHQIFVQAEQSFASLDPELRARFNNNPVEMLAFIESADPATLRDVFGEKAPLKAASAVVTPASGVSEVNKETIAEQK